MAQTAKNTLDTSLKDKLKVTHALMLLLSFLAGQIDFSSLDIVPVTKVVIIMYVGALVLAAYVEDHRHKEQTGHYPKGVEIVDEIIKWAKKVLESKGIEIDEKEEEQMRKEGKKVMSY